MNPSVMIEGDKVNFINTPIPKNAVLIGQFIRFNNGVNYLYPHYDLVFKDFNTHIVSCKKQSGSFGANYYISAQESSVS